MGLKQSDKFLRDGWGIKAGQDGTLAHPPQPPQPVIPSRQPTGQKGCELVRGRGALICPRLQHLLLPESQPNLESVLCRAPDQGTGSSHVSRFSFVSVVLTCTSSTPMTASWRTSPLRCSAVTSPPPQPPTPTRSSQERRTTGTSTSFRSADPADWPRSSKRRPPATATGTWGGRWGGECGGLRLSVGEGAGLGSCFWVQRPISRFFSHANESGEKVRESRVSRDDFIPLVILW